MRRLLIVLSALPGPTAPAFAQVHVGLGIGAPGASIGINLPTCPRLVRVPDYPVCDAPELQANFFYDGLYGVLEGDDWRASSGYHEGWDRRPGARPPVRRSRARTGATGDRAATRTTARVAATTSSPTVTSKEPP